jgi:hypothetical protein
MEVDIMSKAQRKPAPTELRIEPADERPSPEQQERYRKAASLLRQWMAEKDEEEDAVWPMVEEEMKGIRVHFH